MCEPMILVFARWRSVYLVGTEVFEDADHGFCKQSKEESSWI